MNGPDIGGGGPYGVFARYYDAVYLPLVDYEGDVSWLDEVFRRFAGRPVKRVLDLGCGTGTHAVLLARSGYAAEGVDLSEGLLEQARAKAKEAAPGSVLFHHDDMTERLPDGPFDAVISMFGAFNYVAQDDRAERLVRMVAERLPRGGLFVFEFWNPLGARPQQSWDRTDTDDGRKIFRLMESRYGLTDSTLHLAMEVIVLRNSELEVHFREGHHLRMRTPREVRALLEPAGFVVEAFTQGEREGKTFDAPERDTFRIMVVARRT